MSSRDRENSPVPDVSATAIHYKIRAMQDRLSVLEAMSNETRAAIEQCKREHTKNTNNLRTEVSTLSDTTRELGTVKRSATWVLAIIVPMMLIGGVSVIQSMAHQDALEKDADAAAAKAVEVERRMRTIEVDVGSIKHEQKSTRQTLEKVSETLVQMKESQARVEEVIGRRRR